MKTWTNIGKEEWGAGPWQNEPDKAQWIDEATGFDCLIVRGPAGALCGYVGLPPGHPLHGVNYNEVDAEVHGGLTFSELCHETNDPAVGICHVPEPGRPDNVWWLGFDCAHYLDMTPSVEARYRVSFRGSAGNEGIYRDFDYVKGEVESLAAQLKEQPR